MVMTFGLFMTGLVQLPWLQRDLRFHGRIKGARPVGAYLIGLIENLFGAYVSIEFKSVVAFAIIVLVLCVKPSGLFARHYVKKV